MVDTKMKTPWHLWVVGIVGLLFNGMGLADFAMFEMEGPPYLAQAGIPPAQIALYASMPLWATLAWGVGVAAAVVGAVLLLLRRRLALAAYAAALATFLLYSLYLYGIAQGVAVMGNGMIVMSVFIAAMLLFFCWYARTMTARGILR